jgi:hypothetical protein
MQTPPEGINWIGTDSTSVWTSVPHTRTSTTEDDTFVSRNAFHQHLRDRRELERENFTNSGLSFCSGGGFVYVGLHSLPTPRPVQRFNRQHAYQV